MVPERRWSHACAHTGTLNGLSGIKERVHMKMEGKVPGGDRKEVGGEGMGVGLMKTDYMHV